MSDEVKLKINIKKLSIHHQQTETRATVNNMGAEGF